MNEYSTTLEMRCDRSENASKSSPIPKYSANPLPRRRSLDIGYHTCIHVASTWFQIAKHATVRLTLSHLFRAGTRNIEPLPLPLIGCISNVMFVPDWLN